MTTPQSPRTPREAQVEAVFARMVRERLAGVTWKLAPTRVGIPDRLVMLPGGRMFLVELKTDNGGLSEAQAHLHAELARNQGITVHVVKGVPGARKWVEARLADGDDLL